MTTSLFAVVIPAAGSGKRFGAGDKLLVMLRGQSVLQRSVALFARRRDVGPVVVVTAPERFESYREHLAGVIDGDRLVLAEGGAERYESVYRGLQAIPKGPAFVAIHDAARPLTLPVVIDAAFAGAVSHGGSVPVVAEPATLKRLDAGGLVIATVDRSGLYQAQTPQCFKLDQLVQAYAQVLAGDKAGITDDAQIFERAGHAVLGTPGDVTNLKITTAGDTAMAEAILTARQSTA